MTSSTKKTANESVSDIDPGGTRKTQDKGGAGGAKHVEHHVESGDRNQMPKPDNQQKS